MNAKESESRQESHYDFQVVLILFTVENRVKRVCGRAQLFTVSIKKKSRRDYVRYKIKHVPIEMSSLTLMRTKTFSVNLWLAAAAAAVCVYKFSVSCSIGCFFSLLPSSSRSIKIHYSLLAVSRIPLNILRVLSKWTKANRFVLQTYTHIFKLYTFPDALKIACFFVKVFI